VTRAVGRRDLWPFSGMRFLVSHKRVVSGHPLLMDAALKAVLLWKYEPTTLERAAGLG
jgi:hypothetical protein